MVPGGMHNIEIIGYKFPLTTNMSYEPSFYDTLLDCRFRVLSIVFGLTSAAMIVFVSSSSSAVQGAVSMHHSHDSVMT